MTLDLADLMVGWRWFIEL